MLAKSYKQLMESMTSGLVSKKALSAALLDHEIFGWYTSDQE